MQNVKTIQADELDVPADSAPLDGMLMKMSIGLGVIVVGSFAVLAALLPYYVS